MATHPTLPLALTYDDVLLIPQYSEVLPTETDVGTDLAPDIHLAAPIVSSAMDTVTEATLAIAMARAGGLGFIHKNLGIAAQAAEVARVKASPAQEEGTAAVSTLDARGRLRAGAAVGVGPDRRERVAALVEAGVDIVVIDTAHGHSRAVLDAVAATKAEHPALALLAGNVATAEGTVALIDAGADAVKVGIGPGSICTTRVVAGVGVPQLSAVLDCAAVAAERGRPIVADGGIRYSGDVVKALAAGAACVMAGSILAATEEAPGRPVLHDGRTYKAYRGMGSLGAMGAGSADRYFQAGQAKLVPEGVEGMVPLKGPLGAVLFQLVGGLRAGMGYLGAKDLRALRQRARFVRITAAGGAESHVHDIVVTEAAPNY
jgi:IMP dehydrogenase